jgi:hypothetical protein
MNRGDRREKIRLDDVDRQDFLKTLAEWGMGERQVGAKAWKKPGGADHCRWGWTEEELGRARQKAPGKMAIAARLRRTTNLTRKWIAVRIGSGTSQSANARVNQWLRNHPNPSSASSAPIHQPSPTIPTRNVHEENTMIWPYPLSHGEK